MTMMIILMNDEMMHNDGMMKDFAFASRHPNWPFFEVRRHTGGHQCQVEACSRGHDVLEVQPFIEVF